MNWPARNRFHPPMQLGRFFISWKRLTLSHASQAPITFTIEADFTGTGNWSEVLTIMVKPGQKVEHPFPNAFGAYWLRVVADADTTATAQFEYL